MMRTFHASFRSLTWTIDHIEEIRPGVARIKFSLMSIDTSGEVNESQGNEYVLTFNGLLQHVGVMGSE